ncbi:MAG: hypothetical protein H0X03_00445 [Nitrosopumilus sp.]|nr:hypothetical protein [Nitrosopumilus sp.]
MNKSDNNILNKMTKVKIIEDQNLSNIQNAINKLLQEEEVKQLVNIKFTTHLKNNVDTYTFLIIYEENVNQGKEDPQMYE